MPKVQEVSEEQLTYAEKIAKLLRKAESTTPEEAEMLIAKAQELMTKYAIEQMLIDEALGKRDAKDAIITEEFVYTGGFRVALGQLAFNIMQYNGVKVVLLRDSKGRMVNGKYVKQCYILAATGFRSDMERVRMLDTSLQLQATRAQNDWHKTHKDLPDYTLYEKAGARALFLDRRQFVFSFAEGVGEKLRDATARGREAAQSEHTAAGGASDSVALVLQSREIQVQAEFERMYPHLRAVRSSQRPGSNYASQAGLDAGRRADVGQPGLKGRRGLNK